MTEPAIRAILNEVLRQWHLLPDNPSSLGAWIRLDPPLNEHGVRIEEHVVPIQVWFLDHSGIHEREHSSYARFDAVLLNPRWLSPKSPRPHEGVFGRRHEIGLVSFARYADTPIWGLTLQWGGLYGGGYRCTVDASAESITEMKQLWVS